MNRKNRACAGAVLLRIAAAMLRFAGQVSYVALRTFNRSATSARRLAHRLRHP